jgi:hypothetical protein
MMTSGVNGGGFSGSILLESPPVPFKLNKLQNHARPIWFASNPFT